MNALPSPILRTGSLMAKPRCAAMWRRASCGNVGERLLHSTCGDCGVPVRRGCGKPHNDALRLHNARPCQECRISNVNARWARRVGLGAGGFCATELRPPALLLAGSGHCPGRLLPRGFLHTVFRRIRLRLRGAPRAKT